MNRLLVALASILLATALLAQTPDARENSTPVDHEVVVDATTSQLSALVATGYRIVDLEVRSTTPTFTATLVRNTGSHAVGWWWYTNLTAAQVGAALTQNLARLIDLEPYESAGGSLRFACVMVDNTGANAKAWWWLYNSTSTAIAGAIGANNARLVDLDEYEVGGQTFRSAVMIANSGADYRAWWWYLDVDAAQIGTYLAQNQARIYDLERRSNGKFDVVMIRDAQPKAWWWWTGLTSEAQIEALLDNHGARAIDVETYTVQSGFLILRRYAVVALNNSNALTTEIGGAMRAVSDGTVGCWLDDLSTSLSGPKLASLNGDTVFEPASTMKTLHHVHAMRQVSLGAASLTTLLPVSLGANGSCPTGGGTVVNEPLQSVLDDMMVASDNNRTAAVQQHFGLANILGTAASFGMSSTGVNHTLGCGAEAILAPNTITLRDLSRLHRQVATGYLGSQRDLFYDLMFSYHSFIDPVIDAEAALLGLPAGTVLQFKQLRRIVGKNGAYSYSTLLARCRFGWMSLPAIENGALVQREYTFGAFVNGGTSGAGADQAIDTALPLLFRDAVREALSTWVGTQASMLPFGAGCGAPVPATLVPGALPRIGGTASFQMHAGRPNGIALLVYGTSTTNANGLPLPFPLAPIGAAPGCVALNDLIATDVAPTGAGGVANATLAIPANYGLIGAELFLQFWSFGAGPFLTTNGLAIRVGT